MRVSGCKNHYKFFLSAGAKAKSVTNNLPILSVLAEGVIFLVMIMSQINPHRDTTTSFNEAAFHVKVYRSTVSYKNLLVES